MPEKQTHQIAITALRSAAPTSGGFGPDRCGRVPCLAMAASSVRTSSTKTSISANAAHGPGDVLAGRTAVPIVCGASVLLTTNARWLVVLPGVTFNPTPSCNHASTGWLVLATSRHLEANACLALFVPPPDRTVDGQPIADRPDPREQGWAVQPCLSRRRRVCSPFAWRCSSAARCRRSPAPHIHSPREEARAGA